MLGRVAALPSVVTPLRDAIGCVLAAAVVAGEPVPPFANTAMDGYALRAADVAAAPAELRVDGTLLAGADPSTVVLRPGGAVRIMTGAAIPDGADAIVMVESTEALGDDRVRIGAVPKVGDHIRPAGDDISVGAVLAEPGHPLTPALAGVLASAGVVEVEVHRRPRVGVLSTGDELVEGAAALRPGQIRESNRQVLLPLLAEAGCDPVDLGLVVDDDAAITAAIEGAATHCDALLTSGGVSMGDVDLVKVVLDRIGDMRWMQISIRPAKPFAFGTVPMGERVLPVFGLPGNPVSSVVSFELLARPALRRMLGHPDDALDRPTVVAVADEPLRRRADGRDHYVRVVAGYGADGRVHVRSAGAQGSHQLRALAAANALAVLPDGDGVAAGGDISVLLLAPPQ